jgi:hypothetical protein
VNGVPILWPWTFDPIEAVFITGKGVTLVEDSPGPAALDRESNRVAVVFGKGTRITRSVVRVASACSCVVPRAELLSSRSSGDTLVGKGECVVLHVICDNADELTDEGGVSEDDFKDEVNAGTALNVTQMPSTVPRSGFTNDSEHELVMHLSEDDRKVLQAHAPIAWQSAVMSLLYR